MKINFCTFIFLFLLTFTSYSQLLKQKPDYKLQLGTIFSTTRGYGSGISTYVSPEIGYSLTSRFRINAGISIINTNLFGVTPFYSLNGEQKSNGNFTSTLIYLNGQYKINERLTMNGSVYKQFNLFDDPPDNPYSKLNDRQGFNMAIDYKAAENFHIQAGFGYSKGYSPYYHDPFGASYGQPPFSW
jgi:hypothetical protein